MAISLLKDEFIFDVATVLAGSKSPSTTHTIREVPEKIRSKSPDAFTPQVISIGHLHRRNEHLLAMERHKMQYTLSLLQRTHDDRDVLQEWYSAIERLMEDRVRQYYQIRDPDAEKTLLLYDAGFICELLIRSYEGDLRDDDPILADPRTTQMVRRDLALVENQIPFIVLKELVRIIEVNYGGEYHLPPLEHLALLFFKLDPSTYKTRREYNYDYFHLFGLIHDYYVSSSTTKYSRVPGEWNLIKAATKLISEDGIKFRSTDGKTSLYDLKFDNGEMTIPPLPLEKSFFLNLIALEQMLPDRPHYTTSYGLFLDYLVDTPQDVEFLVQKGIIPHSYGDYKEVAQLFNNICKQAVVRNFLYAGICQEVDAYCNSRWNLQKHTASLIRDYCKTPWMVLGIVSAIILLGLTFVQTIYSILSYKKVP